MLKKFEGILDLTLQQIFVLGSSRNLNGSSFQHSIYKYCGNNIPRGGAYFVSLSGFSAIVSMSGNQNFSYLLREFFT